MNEIVPVPRHGEPDSATVAEIETPCTCGHPASSHNRLGVCFATQPRANQLLAELCPCSDFTTDDVAVAKAAGVLVPGSTPGATP